MKNYRKRYHVVRGSYHDGTWMSKGFVNKIAACIAAKIESTTWSDGKVYVFDTRSVSNCGGYKTLAIYNTGKKDHETMKILGIA